LTLANSFANILGVRGHKRYKDGAWRLVVANGVDPVTGRRRTIYETVRGPNNRAGAKLADARLAELIAAVESGRYPEERADPRRGPSVAEIAAGWQEANRPRQDPRSGDWIGWSPKTAKTVADNFRLHILPAIGTWNADAVTGLHIDRLYRRLEEETGLSGRCSTGRSVSGWFRPTPLWRRTLRG
jgi:hypothetical protein